MFSSLSDKLSSTFKRISGSGRLTEKNIKDVLKDVRVALLEADVALPIVKSFIGDVKRAAVGQEVSKSLTPGQAFIKIVQRELTCLMGKSNESLNLSTTPPAVILMAGLQGSGKTTSTIKLAKLLKEKCKKKVMVVSCDVYRPAAITQLQVLSDEVSIDWIESAGDEKPLNIAKRALDVARKNVSDVLIVDTAGRLHIDETMMTEIKTLHEFLNPIETLFVADAMMGQDAVKTAETFHNALALTGVILTKVDGDSRGGAALSIRQTIGQPIKFLGVGEKTDALEAFHPDRIASRILGMGDLLSLIEEAEYKLDKDKAQNLMKKVSKGTAFNFNDFRDQISEMQKMGGMDKMLSNMPGAAQMTSQISGQFGDATLKKTVAMIDSMTLLERRKPDLIKSGRKRRIASGSGTDIVDVNRMLKQFLQMQKMMKKMGGKGGKMRKMMSGVMGGMGGAGAAMSQMQQLMKQQKHK